MIKALIFDLNGVFIQSPLLSDRFNAQFHVPSNKFIPALKEVMDKVRRPDAGDAFRYWKPYLNGWKVNLTRDEFFGFWFGAEKESEEMVRLARRLKDEHIALFILSNNFIERANYYKKTFSFLDELFEKVYYSWQTGFVKPSKSALEKVLQDNNLKAEECIYVDNQENNIDVAKNLGMKTILFRDYSSFEKKLEELRDGS